MGGERRPEGRGGPGWEGVGGGGRRSLGGQGPRVGGERRSHREVQGLRWRSVVGGQSRSTTPRLWKPRREGTDHVAPLRPKLATIQ